MRRAAALCALLLAGGASGAFGQQTARQPTPRTSGKAPTAMPITLRDAGPDSVARLIEGVLRKPHAVVRPADGRYIVSRDSGTPQSIFVLQRETVVEGEIHGDLVVVGADVYVHPGAHVSGRIIAFGGGVYESALGQVDGPNRAFRDFTYDVTPELGGYALSYRPLSVRERKIVGYPGFRGVMLPTYDRTNGISLPVGMNFSPAAALSLRPTLTYRSQLGRLDPGLLIVVHPTNAVSLTANLRRDTFTNDGWIWPELNNSLETLIFSEDTRNYYRATRGDAVLSLEHETSRWAFQPYLGVRWERGESARPGIGARGGPWSLFGRHGEDDMLRPNPAIDPGTIASGVAGAAWKWEGDGIIARARLDGEFGRYHGTCLGCAVATNATFSQGTFDGSIQFPTFGLQSLRFDGHAVASGGDPTPRQRYAYLGGPGTLSTLDLLELGGDDLAYLDARYAIPVPLITLPLVGMPTVTLREVLGGAAVRRFPSISQAMGLRLSAGPLYGEVLADPDNRHVQADIGISLTR